MSSYYHTYISRKQIGVIFANWKRGNLSLTEDHIHWLYNRCAEIRGFNDNNAFEDVLQRVKHGVDAIFAGDLAEAQEKIEEAYDYYHIIYAEC